MLYIYIYINIYIYRYNMYICDMMTEATEEGSSRNIFFKVSM